MNLQLFGAAPLSRGPSGSMWSFLLSSIQVHMLFVGICSFWPKIHVFHHGLVFSNLIFFSVLSKLMCISTFKPSSSPFNSFVILLIHSTFLCILGCHILVQNCSASLVSSCWYIFMSSPLTCFVALECPILSVLLYPFLISF